VRRFTLAQDNRRVVEATSAAKKAKKTTQKKGQPARAKGVRHFTLAEGRRVVRVEPAAKTENKTQKARGSEPGSKPRSKPKSEPKSKPKSKPKSEPKRAPAGPSKPKQQSTKKAGAERARVKVALKTAVRHLLKRYLLHKVRNSHETRAEVEATPLAQLQARFLKRLGVKGGRTPEQEHNVRKLERDLWHDPHAFKHSRACWDARPLTCRRQLPGERRARKRHVLDQLGAQLRRQQPLLWRTRPGDYGRLGGSEDRQRWERHQRGNRLCRRRNAGK
jgi:hypothetical protein